jgi:hypothetical protein
MIRYEIPKVASMRRRPYMSPYPIAKSRFDNIDLLKLLKSLCEDPHILIEISVNPIKIGISIMM